MALNFLVTGVKMLQKSLDKKKMKKDAKKFVGGDKEEKRAKVSKIVAEMDEKPKAKVIKPSKLMNIDIDKVAKVTPDSAKIDYKLFTEKIDNIVGMTDALAFLTGAQSEQKKDELKLLRQQREAEKKRKKEAKLEKKDSMLGKIGKGIKKAAQSPLDAMINFFTKMAIGALALFLINNADKIKEIFKNLGDNIEKFGKILRVSIFAFKEGMNLAKASVKLMGKGIGKLLSPVGKAFKFIGSKFRNTLSLLGKSLMAGFKAIPGMAKLTKMTSDAIRAGKKGVDVSRTALAGLRTTVATGATSAFNRVTGNVFRRGLGRAPSRMLIKFFGPNTAKAIVRSPIIKVIGKAAKKGIRVPVLGPIIVAVTSILSGDKIGKTIFRTLGAVFGGIIGSAIAAGFTFGAAAPLGMLLGELIGEFIGGFLADMFFGDADETKGVDFLKKKIGQLLDGGKVVMDFALGALGNLGNFFKDGFTRFVEDFPTVKVPKVKGLQSALGLAASALGLDEKSKFIEKGKLLGKSINLVTSLPNLALLTPLGMPFLLPHLKNSFFPSEEKEVVPETSTSALEGGEEGGEETAETTTAVVETPDNSDAVIDDSSESGGETTSAKLAETNTSSASSSVSDVSSQTTYEESAAGTVILGEPSRGNFAPGAAGDSQYQQAVVMYNNQKEMLNSYFKTQVRASLYKI